MYYLNQLSENKDNILNASSFIEVYKPYSMTPLELVQNVINSVGAKKGSFSGRLDPMACGCTRIFLDNNCKNSKVDLATGKSYRFQFILGIQTESCDMLGLPIENINSEIYLFHILDRIDKFLKNIQENGYIQKIPKHSSYVVSNMDGIKKPLWWWAKQKRIQEINIPALPKKLYNYYDLKLIWMPLNKVIKKSIERISNISPQMKFNQEEIINAWQIHKNNTTTFPIIEMIVDVSSGFYIRQLVADLGTYLDCPVTTLEIERLSYL